MKKVNHLNGDNCPNWKLDKGFGEFFCMCGKKSYTLISTVKLK